jgi:hypothetical protein
MQDFFQQAQLDHHPRLRADAMDQLQEGSIFYQSIEAWRK